MRWLLPEAIEDVLPAEAVQLERLRRALLDDLFKHGYELVVPPMLEFLESVLTGSGSDLDLQTFKLMDQLSGRTMGLRADMTPQVARIDAHLLNRCGVTRLCYSGNVVHTVPGDLLATREPIQIGAEIYGHAGLEADIEIVRLLACVVRTSGLSAFRIDLGHIGIFRALMRHANVDDGLAQSMFSALQRKDVPTLAELATGLPENVRLALLSLPELYGDAAVLDHAQGCLKFSGDTGDAVQGAIDDLRRLASSLPDLPISFDLADMRGYHYHNGVAFAVYADGSAGAIARGGRYDNVGEVYGRKRPATGFSMDLRKLVQLASRPVTTGAILAPWGADVTVHGEIARLRESGERVVQELPGHDGHWREAGCDRKLVRRDNGWIVESLEDV